MRRLACALLVVACGSKTTPTATTTSALTEPTTTQADRDREQQARAEQAKHDEIVASHREAELEQQNAFAGSCAEPKPWTKHERCLPSCYPTELPTARADVQLIGATEVDHVVCKRSGEVPYAIVDELEPTLRVQPTKRRFPREPAKASWQGALATWFHEAAKLPRGDVVVVKGSWKSRKHPVSREVLSCVTVTHFAKSLRGKLGDCGAVAGANAAGATCEAAGNGAARAINVVHYRLVEAKRLQASGKREPCQQAALEAIAVARGLPRWRQYKKLNVDEWNDKLVYKTRFDGVIDEDALFAIVTGLGSEAEAVYAGCGGAAPATTNVDQEQSFHMCW